MSTPQSIEVDGQVYGPHQIRQLRLERDKMREALQFIAETVDTSQTCYPGNESIAVKAMDALST